MVEEPLVLCIYIFLVVFSYFHLILNELADINQLVESLYADMLNHLVLFILILHMFNMNAAHFLV